MTRRRLVALVSVAVLFTVGLAAVAVLLIATHTDYGHEQLRRRLVQPLAEARVHGTIHIGRIGGNLLDSVTIDTLDIRDKQGEVFLSTGRVTVKFDPRDVWDRRLAIRFAEVQHPYMHLVQRANGTWNFNEIFGSRTPSVPKTIATRDWGSYVVLNSVRGRNGTLVLSLPWHPDDSLRGANRDSALKFNLARTDHMIRRTADGYSKTYTWKNAYAVVSHARLADPDSDIVPGGGREIRVDTLHVEELDPPFSIRNAHGLVRQLADSVWFTASHFDLPASTGIGQGKVVWGSGLPIRYDITVRGDSIALNDVNWVYPTLPRTGGGSVVLRIKNDPKNLDVVDFKLSKMDIRSTKSHVVGNMSFGVGAPMLLVRDVELKADPVDFDLIRALNGKPFPVDWQGQLFGTVKGRGGALTHFYVDDARGSWRDTHVAGAQSQFAGRGELDIFQPAFTNFHGFNVNVASLDLRSIEYLFPAFPRLGGVVSGTATLDSSWLDVRFSNAQITHRDGPGDPSQLTGSGRVTWGEPYMLYDVALNAAPLSVSMLARSYPGLPFRGLVSGPIRARGTSPDLEVVTSLQGVTGSLSFEGRLDVDSVGGYGAHGRGQFSGLNLAQLLDRASIPAGTFSGHYEADLAGPNASDIRGRADLEIERTVFDNLRIYPSRATIRFAEGRMYVDSLRLRTAAGTVIAQGALGLPKRASDGSDSLVITVNVDSLGGLRRYLGRADVTNDSLNGALSLTTVVRGRLDSLDVVGKVTANDLFVRGTQGTGLVGRFDLRNILSQPSGTFTFHADSLLLGGVAFDTLGGTIDVTGRRTAAFTAGTARTRARGLAASARGELSAEGGRQVLRLDSLALDVGDSKWALAFPGRITNDSAALSVDSLVLRNRDSAVVSLSALVPNSGAVAAQLRASHIPLADVGVLAQLPVDSGLADVDAHITGTKAAPEITATASLTGVKRGSMQVERAAATGDYRRARFTGNLDLFRNGQTALRATALVPLDLTLFTARVPKEPVHIAVRADSADLGVLQTFAPPGALEITSGRLMANVDVGGTWGALTYSGNVAIQRGQIGVQALNITLADVNADAALANNTLLIRDISATSSRGRPGNRIAIAGTIAHLDSSAVRAYSLRVGANDFRAIDRRTRAVLDLSTGADSLRLTGAGSAVGLTGQITIDRGQLFLPDPAVAGKQLIDVESDTAATFSAAKSGALLNRLGLKTAAVTVRLGDDVKLKSSQADIKLTGSLNVGMQRALVTGADGRESPQYLPTVDGTLVAPQNSGTYTLDLGPALRRDFNVTQGSVHFDGSADLNPNIDISAIYKVHRYKQEDIGVIVHVTGPLRPGPVIDLSSDQSYEISPSDLLSYLITGDAGFDFAAQGEATRRIATFLAPTLSSALASGLRQKLGSWVDLVQFQGASAEASRGAAATGADLRGSAADFFYGASLGGQTHFGNNIFLSFSAGLCPFDPRQTGPEQRPLDALGGKLEYRFRPDFSVQTGREPGTAARYCGAGPSLGSVTMPSQFSFSLLRTWRF